MKTIQLPIDEDLLIEVNEAIEVQKTTWADFIRASLIHYLAKLKIREKEKQHKEGYLKHPVAKDEFDVWEDEQAWVN